MSGSLLMLLFCVALGLQQVAIKAVAADVAPLAQVAIRSTLAALLVVAVARLRGVRWVDARAVLGPGLAVAAGFAAEFTFIALGLGYTTASHMSVFLYTAPVFAALGLHWWVPGEQLSPRHWVGIAIAFGGMVLAMAPGGKASAGPAPTALVVGDILGILAGMSWAATTIVIRTTRLSSQRPIVTLAYQLVFAGLSLLVVAGLLGDLSTMRLSPLAWASLAFQTLGISFAMLLLWFALLRRYLASRLGVFSFLSPVFGVIFGALLLGETLTASFVAGGVAIIVGIVIVSLPSGAARA
ncbi:DMT family transporter [Salinisphaera sp. Q1T1-3]|nr:DMT family transporter [Salinisphaera sp. Q1T1-3]